MQEAQAQAVANAVRQALNSMGLDVLRSGEFFGMKQPK